MKLIIGVVLAFAIGAPAYAQDYYAQDYDPEYLPYNFDDAVESRFDGCLEVAERYDDITAAIDAKISLAKKSNSRTSRDNYVIPWTERPFFLSGDPEARVGSFSELKEIAEEQFRLCIIDYRKQQEREEQDKEREEKREDARRAQQKRDTAIQSALDRCDFAFFKKMSDREKMASFVERRACMDKAAVDSTAATTAPAKVTDPGTLQAIQNLLALVAKLQSQLFALKSGAGE